MAKKADIQKHLEAILGYELPGEAAERITLVQAVASSTVSDNASTTLRHLIVARPNRCYGTRLLDVGGFWFTGNDGKSTFRLTDFICHTGERFGRPINVVATPLSSTPCFLTLNHTLVDNGADVQIEVWSWDAAGAPAPAVSFDWRCRVELPIIIT
jgi:hypothetical protein